MTQVQSLSIEDQIQATENRLRETELIAGVPTTVSVGGVTIDITSWSITKLATLDRPKLEVQIAKEAQKKYDLVLAKKSRKMLQLDSDSDEYWAIYDELDELVNSEEHHKKSSELKKKRVDAMYNLVYHIINDDTSNPTHQLDWIKENLNTVDGIKLIEEHERLNDLDAFIDRVSQMPLAF